MVVQTQNEKKNYKDGTIYIVPPFATARTLDDMEQRVKTEASRLAINGLVVLTSQIYDNRKKDLRAIFRLGVKKMRQAQSVYLFKGWEHEPAARDLHRKAKKMRMGIQIEK